METLIYYAVIVLGIVYYLFCLGWSLALLQGADKSLSVFKVLIALFLGVVLTPFTVGIYLGLKSYEVT